MLHSILISLVVGPMLASGGDVDAATDDRRFPRYVASFSGGLVGMPPMSASASQLLRAGYFNGRYDFDRSEGVDIRNVGSYSAAFVTSVGLDGAYRWTYVADGPGNDQARGVAIDSHENVTIVGEFYGSVDFDPGPGETVHESLGSFAAFIVRLDDQGVFQWSRSLGGRSDSIAYALDVDSVGNVILGGNFGYFADLDPGPGEYIPRLNNFNDVFVVKLDTSGSLVWAKAFGGRGWDSATDLAVGPENEVVVTGRFRYSADFDPGPGADVHFAINREYGWFDVFITKFGADGSYLWTRTMQAEPESARVEVGLDGAVICAGHIYRDADMDPTQGVDWRTVHPSPNSSKSDGYVTKLASDGSYEWTVMIGGAGFDYVTDVAVGAEGDVIAVGFFSDVMILGDGPNMQELQCDAPLCGFRVGLSRDGRLQWATASGLVYNGVVAMHDERIYIAETRSGSSQSFTIDLSPTCEFAQWDSDETNATSFITVLQYGPPRGGDVDFDGDVDLRDVARFYQCYTGDPRDKHSDPLPVDCDAGCDEFDLSPDAVLDRDDYALLLKRFEGPK